MADDNGLSIEWIPPNGRGKIGTIIARLGQESYTNRTDIVKVSARSSLLDQMTRRWPALQEPARRQEFTAKLERLAADEASRIDKPQEQDAADAGTPEAAALLAKMPEAVRAEAHAMLQSPDLLKRVVDDVGLLGVAGEKELAATVYLVGTSRLLPQPLAVILQGPSSSGKSYVIKKAASLFPPEAVILATQLTPQALHYMKPGSLVHRFIVAGERCRAEDDEAADATRALREMLSEGRLSKLLPVKMEGRPETVLIQQDGPIAYIESTTLTKVFAEDANRCILLTTDEQEEQTRRIVSKLASVYAGGAAVDAQRIIDRHHALQRMLQPYTVLVPFAQRLGEAIDHHRVKTRRAFPQLISMIQASALLHQGQRQVDGDGRLLADADDYQLARRLLALPMARQLGGPISEPAARFLQRLRGWFTPGDTFATSDAKRKETGSQSSVYGWLGELRGAGLVEQVEAQRGNKAARWRLSGDAPDPDAAAVLPPVEKVFA